MSIYKVKGWQERFWKKVKKTDYCWLWIGAISTGKYGGGYGAFYFEGRVRLAHKVLYEFIYGKVPDSFQLDHKCRIRKCVNPEHLEVVTSKENNRRGLKGILLKYCAKGHSYNKENTTYHGKDKRRKCKRCINLLQKFYKQKISLATLYNK